ncbi:MAG TPA: MMPL family transporter [Trebonia sp.]|nr:MMPL family transporter [Trebonia sp.]
MRQPQSSVFPETPLPGDLPGRNHAHGRRKPRPPFTERVGAWSARHRKAVVFGWLVLVIAVFAGGQVAGSRNLYSYDSGQAGQAERVLNQVAPKQLSAQSEIVLIQAKAPGATFATDPEMRSAAGEVAAALAAFRGSTQAVQSPLAGGAAGKSLVSPDGRSALVTFTIPGTVTDSNQAVAADQRAVAAVQARHPDLRIAESGDASIAAASSLNFGHSEEISAVITLVLLLIVFGALVAAGIPVLLAVTALTAAIGLLTVFSHLLPVGQAAFEVMVIVGMAVGVDYSLFYLRREREERAAGKSFAEALRIAARTSGRTILVSGLTVMAALAGLFIVGISVPTGMALGAISAVGIAVIGSLTVLPALLAWLGPKADAGRIPFLGRRRAAARPSRFWAGLARRVVARPLAWGGVAALALLALAVPAAGMHLGEPAINAPKSAATATMTAIELAFPQAPDPAEIVVSGPGLSGPKVTAAVGALRARVAAQGPGGPLHGPVTTDLIGHGHALVVGVTLAGNGTDTTTARALATLRDQVLPATLGKVPGISYAVGGAAPGYFDSLHQLDSSLPYVFAFVGVLALLLLLVAFRSIAVSVTSIALNLLSVGAAYGLITLIFQDGRLQGPLGYTAFGGVIWYVPLLMFVFLFGISMDYHVFILSRIRELWTQGSTAKDAVVTGIASSAGVVTSAALIMVAVFSIFVSIPLVDLKILGVGTAAAVLIDATVVRGVLVPAALALLGDRAWGRARTTPAPS